MVKVMCKKLAAITMKGKIIVGVLSLAILCLLVVNGCCCFISYPPSPSMQQLDKYKNKNSKPINYNMENYPLHM